VIVLDMRLLKVLLIFALGAMIRTNAQGQSSQHQVYSNVAYNEEAGDLIGTELELNLQGKSATGQLRIYQGSCADPIAVSGTFSPHEMRLAGQSGILGKVEIVGAIKAGELRATVRLALAEKPEFVILKKIPKAHCSN
jgi:hypothetical protein